MGHSFACSIALEVANSDAEKVAAAVLVDPVMPAAAARAAGRPRYLLRQPEFFATREEAERHFRETRRKSISTRKRCGAWPWTS